MLEDLLGSKTRARVLRLLLHEPERGFHVRELVRAVGSGTSGVQSEVERLERLGLVTSERDARGRRVIRLAADHPASGPLAGLVAAETALAYGSPAVGAPRQGAAPGAVNPRIQPLLPALADACRSFAAVTATLFGSATDPDIAVVPRDLDVLVTFDRGDPRPVSERFFGLRDELARVAGLPVDLVELDAVTNPYLLAGIERGAVDLYA